MSAQLLTALLIYALVTSITPGPNNTMLLASGVNYGFRRSIPHILGISIGFWVMVFAVGLGFAQLFTAYPLSYTILRFVGAAYLLWLAWKIATTVSGIKDATDSGSPMTFLAAAAFQWVNPKAWVMAVGAITAYTPANAGLVIIALVATVYAVVNLPSVALWAVFGTSLRKLLTNPKSQRVFNITMAVLLVLSLYPILTTSL